MLRKLVLLLAVGLGVSSAASNQCCASCLAQTDPKTTNLTYDPLVFSQCSAVLGSICCYGCDFSHGAPSYSSGVTFSSGGAAQTTVGTRVTLSFNGISRITYDLLAKNQVKSTFVGNLSTQVLPSSDGSFSLCARTPGTIALRGWGADSCRQVTVEYTITVAAGDGTATCDAGTVKPAGGGSDSSAKPNQPVVPQDDAGKSKPSGGKGDASDIENCSATRGSVKTKDDGTKFCECVGDWRNPPLCDAYSWTKTIVTILGAVAAVLSIAFSVRAYVKSKKAEKEAREKDLDVASENELETMRISPAKRDASSSAVPSPATTVNQNSKRSPARTPLTATPIRTSGHETTL